MTASLHLPSMSKKELRTLGWQVWWISVAIWVMEWFVLLGLATESSIFSNFGLRFFYMASGLFVGFLVWKIASRFHYLQFWKVAAITMGAFFVLGPLHTIGNSLLSFAVTDKWPAQGSVAMTIYGSARFWLHFFLAWGAIILAFSYAKKVRREELARAHAQALSNQAQIQAFRYQIQPHFLFNTFNSIAALILDGSRHQAEDMTRRLSVFLRRALSADATADTSLAKEFEQQVEYLELERERFPDRLKIELDIDEDLQPGRIKFPGFLLQPIVENAVRHGVQRSNKVTRIVLGANKVQSRLCVSVLNSEAASENERENSEAATGLDYVRAQLAARFVEDFNLEHGLDEKGNYVVVIDIPYSEFGA